MFAVLSDGGEIERRLDWESMKDRIDGACEKGLHIKEKIQEAEEKIKKLDEEHEAIIEIFSDERSRQYDMESNLRKKCQDVMNTVEELRKQIKELENNKVGTQRMINGGLVGILVLGSLRPNPGGGGGMENRYLGIQHLGSNRGGGAGVNRGLNEVVVRSYSRRDTNAASWIQFGELVSLRSLSLRGEDTRNTFVGHLYEALKQKGIQTFKDDEKLKQGKTIDNQLIQAIKCWNLTIKLTINSYECAADRSSLVQ
ncbi:Toll/interleukin-1 receptor domain-containing protein [Tanacetum coccineum]